MPLALTKAELANESLLILLIHFFSFKNWAQDKKAYSFSMNKPF